VAILDLFQFSTFLHVIVEIMMQKDRLELNAAFVKRIKHTEEVQQCCKVTGELYFVLVGGPGYA
jgi:Lrp/AsnC family leucine-responsive transcriptional regulator